MAAAKKIKTLTEADLIKAPERDYMNEAQLAFFKQRLLFLEQELAQRALEPVPGLADQLQPFRVGLRKSFIGHCHLPPKRFTNSPNRF